MEEIKHWSHPHPLILRDEKKNDEDECSACCLPISSCPSYVCSQCNNNFYLHKSCAELPQQLQHPFHSLHPLTLFHESPYHSITGGGNCDACGKSLSNGFFFHCAECQFDLDIRCASLVPSLSYEGHDHLLTLFEKIYRPDWWCESCYSPCNALVFRCVECDFNVHKECVESPKQIQHPFHPTHSLTVACDRRGLLCNGCNKWGLSAFRCKECNFSLDMECAKLVPTVKYEGHDKHPLTLFHKIYGHKKCNFCYTRCEASILRCVMCDFNIHKSCAELPKQIKHLFHPLHPLTLGNYLKSHSPFSVTEDVTCNSCHVQQLSCSFSCIECSFHLCLECISMVPTVKFEGHEHLLTILDDIYGDQQCKSCATPCDGLVFRCVECDFNFHIDCFPQLPPIIKHECHVDQLTLTNSVPEEDDDSDEFYCDACEKERNSKLPVYYCADCSFLAHVRCVISEVLPPLIAKQESNARAKNEHIKPDSNVEGLAKKEDIKLDSNIEGLAKKEDIKLDSNVEGLAKKEDIKPDSNIEVLAKKEDIKPDSNIEGFLSVFAVDEPVARGDNVIVSGEMVGVEVTEDPTITKLDEEIEKVRKEVKEQKEKLEAVEAKIEALKGERMQYVLSLRKKSVTGTATATLDGKEAGTGCKLL